MQNAINLAAKPITTPLASIGEDNRYVAFDFLILDSGLVELRAVYNDYSPHTGRYSYQETDSKVIEAEDAIDFAVDMERDAPVSWPSSTSAVMPTAVSPRVSKKLLIA